MTMMSLENIILWDQDHTRGSKLTETMHGITVCNGEEGEGECYWKELSPHLSWRLSSLTICCLQTREAPVLEV